MSTNSAVAFYILGMGLLLQARWCNTCTSSCEHAKVIRTANNANTAAIEEAATRVRP